MPRVAAPRRSAGGVTGRLAGGQARSARGVRAAQVCPHPGATVGEIPGWERRPGGGPEGWRMHPPMVAATITAGARRGVQGGGLDAGLIDDVRISVHLP